MGVLPDRFSGYLLKALLAILIKVQEEESVFPPEWANGTIFQQNVSFGLFGHLSEPAEKQEIPLEQ